jgi:phosphoglycerate kinase
MKAAGGKIGKSLCEEDRLDTANDLMKKRRRKMFAFIYLQIL